MTSIDYEQSYISRLIQINYRNCFIGLFQRKGLTVNGEWITSILINEVCQYRYIQYNIITKELKMSKKGDKGFDYTSISSSNTESNSIMDISNNGLRWEGSSLKNVPFGYGSLYNNDNKLIYRGVMIGNKRECFGIEFYPGIGKIEYIGCYSNNERHVFGMLYDRKGELVYEGDYWFGSTKGELVNEVTVKRIENDNNLVHSLIRKLVIVEGCGNEILDGLELRGYDNLESVKIKKNSFINISFLRISDNDVLNSIVIEGDDCGYGAFNNVKSVVIESDMIYD